MIERILIVTGGREYDNVPFLRDRLDYHEPELLIHGGARGADTIADRWAAERSIPRIVFSIGSERWKTEGKAAGRHRNQEMIDHCYQFFSRFGADGTWLGFWEGLEGLAVEGGPGTDHMVSLMEQHGIPHWDYRYDEPGRMSDAARNRYRR